MPSPVRVGYHVYYYYGYKNPARILHAVPALDPIATYAAISSTAAPAFTRAASEVIHRYARMCRHARLLHGLAVQGHTMHGRTMNGRIMHGRIMHGRIMLSGLWESSMSTASEPPTRGGWLTPSSTSTPATPCGN